MESLKEYVDRMFKQYYSPQNICYSLAKKSSSFSRERSFREESSDDERITAEIISYEKRIIKNKTRNDYLNKRENKYYVDCFDKTEVINLKELINQDNLQTFFDRIINIPYQNEHNHIVEANLRRFCSLGLTINSGSYGSVYPLHCPIIDRDLNPKEEYHPKLAIKTSDNNWAFHEYFVGKFFLNKLRERTPNFSLVYAYFNGGESKLFSLGNSKTGFILYRQSNKNSIQGDLSTLLFDNIAYKEKYDSSTQDYDDLENVIYEGIYPSISMEEYIKSPNFNVSV